MRSLDPDDDIRIVLHRPRSRDRIHITGILLHGSVLHPITFDIDPGKHARLRPVDYAILEIREVPPPRCSRIANRRDAGAEGIAVRIKAPVARVGIGSSGAGVYMDMDVNQTRSYVEAGYIYRFLSIHCGNIVCDSGDLTIRDSNVRDAVDAVLGVDDVP